MSLDLALSVMMGSVDLAAGQLVNGYEIEGSTRAEMAVSLRKQVADNPYTEGTFTVNAVRQNVMEALGVFVYGPTHSVLQQRLQVIKDYVIQPSWTLLWELEGYTETWHCQSSEYSVASSREFQHATMAFIKINVDRLPSLTRTYSDSTTWTG